MNAPFDPQKVMPTQAASKPEKSALLLAEDASAVLDSLAPALLYAINSFESYGLTEEKTTAMLTVAINIAQKAQKELLQAEAAGFTSNVDIQHQLDGVITAIQEMSRFYLNKDYSVRALYGLYYAAKNIDESLSDRISNYPDTYYLIQ